VNTRWRSFARREPPRVIAELELPAASPNRVLCSCPLHREPVGPLTGLCKCCFDAAWGEVAHRYRELGRRDQAGRNRATA
jgi:hypothetical protein